MVSKWPNISLITNLNWFHIWHCMLTLHTRIWCWYRSVSSTTNSRYQWVNTVRPRQDSRYDAYDVLKCIFLNENVWMLLQIPLKFVPKGPINNIPALVQIMAWRRPGDKPLSEPMSVLVPTHICVTRPQWVKSLIARFMGPTWGQHGAHLGPWTLMSGIHWQHRNPDTH